MHKFTESKFKRPTLTEMAKYDRYFEDSLRGYVLEANKDLEDLIKFASKLSNEKLEKVFNYNNKKPTKFMRLIDQILRGNNQGLHTLSKSKNEEIFIGQNKDYDKAFNARRLQMAAFLVKKGIEVLIRHYEATLPIDPRLHKFITNPLYDVSTICDTIQSPRIRIVRNSLPIRYNIEEGKKRSSHT